MEGDDDIQVIYESCNNESWKSARERLRSQYHIVGQSTGFGRASNFNERSAKAGYGEATQMWRGGGVTDSLRSYRSCSSAMSSTSSECSFASSAATQLDPLVAKVEVIDLIDADGNDSNSVEVLEDSDSDMSAQTVREKGPDSANDGEDVDDDYMPLFSTKVEELDYNEEETESVQNQLSSSSSRTATVEVKEEIEAFTSLPTGNDVGSVSARPESTRSAAEVWREACRLSMSSSAIEEEKSPPVFPTFPSTYSTISSCSSLARGVVNLHIGTNSQGQSRALISPTHHEVSSSSDVRGKQDRELTSIWAETHDFGIESDEFLEVEDESEVSLNNNGAEAEVVDLTSEKSSKKKDKASKKSHHPDPREGSSSTHKKEHKSASKHSSKDSADTTTTEHCKDNHRKRSSSSRSPHGSSHSNTRNKRFAAEKCCEKLAPRIGYAQSSPTVCLASNAPRANGLPRYYPVDRHYDFTRWLNAKGELVLHKIKDVATGIVSAPLGCTYDAALDTFIFTRQDSVTVRQDSLMKAQLSSAKSFLYTADHPFSTVPSCGQSEEANAYMPISNASKILFATCEGRILSELTLKGFDRPCAVTVLCPGQALGILDRSNLYLYEHHKKRLSVLATGLHARHRALAHTSCGDFVTVRKVVGQLSITVFDGTQCDTIIASIPFPRVDGAPADMERQPCFADSSKNQIFFTDLRANTLTCVELTKNRLETVYSRCMQKLPMHKGAEADQRFLYMSGIRSDDSGHLLVADARTRSLKLLTSNGQFMKKAIVSEKNCFPYCSSFGISPSGLLMACDRLNSRMILFRIGEETTSESAILTDDFFDRILGRSGVENEVRHLKEAAHRFA